MSSLRIHVAACAAALLLASLCGGLVAAAGLLTGIKGLVFNQNGYKILADHLLEATPSNQLADNTKAVGSLLSKYPDANESFVRLIRAFGSLKSDTRDPESLCSKDNLANLRHLAEAMRHGGNLGPRKITKSIGRLNSMIIALIAKAQPICVVHLDNKWPKGWHSSFSDEDTAFQLHRLCDLPNLFLYEEYFVRPDDESLQRYGWDGSLSHIISEGECWADTPTDPNVSHAEYTKDKKLLGEQLERFVYKPCAEFLRIDQAKSVLEPHIDLRISQYIVADGLMDKYFWDDELQRPRLRVYATRAQELAHSYRACQKLLALPKSEVLNRVYKSRTTK